MIDFSHGNSAKQFQRQLAVGADVAAQIGAGDRHIMGVMVESHLKEGRQDQVPGCRLEYGQEYYGCLHRLGGHGPAAGEACRSRAPERRDSKRHRPRPEARAKYLDESGLGE